MGYFLPEEPADRDVREINGGNSAILRGVWRNCLKQAMSSHDGKCRHPRGVVVQKVNQASRDELDGKGFGNYLSD